MIGQIIDGWIDAFMEWLNKSQTDATVYSAAILPVQVTVEKVTKLDMHKGHNTQATLQSNAGGQLDRTVKLHLCEVHIFYMVNLQSCLQLHLIFSG